MKNGIIKTFAFMFSAMFLSKILGLVRNIVFANFYGTGFEATAFFTASRIPLQLLDLTLGAAISSTFIPVFNEYMQKDGKKRAIEFANNFLNVVILISLVLSILGIVFANPIVKAISPNLDTETMSLTVSLSRILFPVLLFTAVAYVFVGFLQSMDEFNIPAIISVVSNMLLILYLMIFNDKFGVHGVAIAMLIGWGTQIIVQIPSALKKGFKYNLKFSFRDPGLKKVVKLAIPILISSWVQPINNIINLRLASGLEEGQAVSAIEYAYTLYLIIVGVFSYTLSNIIFPRLSKLSADNDEKQFKDIIKKAVSISIFYIIPMSIGVGLLSPNVIKLIYERGEFTAHSTMLTSSALQFYSLGMIGYGLMEVLNKTFYAKQDAKTPMYISGFAIITNVALSILLVKNMGYTGLPLAASITSILTTVIMLLVINKKTNGIVDKNTLDEFIKTCISAIAMGAVVTMIRNIEMHAVISIGLSVVSGFCIYFLCEIALRSSIAIEGINLIRKKLKR